MELSKYQQWCAVTIVGFAWALMIFYVKGELSSSFVAVALASLLFLLLLPKLVAGVIEWRLDRWQRNLKEGDRCWVQHGSMWAKRIVGKRRGDRYDLIIMASNPDFDANRVEFSVHRSRLFPRRGYGL